MQTNATEKAQGGSFERGLELPQPQDLIDLLNRLDIAREVHDEAVAQALESDICALIKAGTVYEGYAGDEGLEVSIVRVALIDRRGNGANIHSFRIWLEVLDGTDVVELRQMELIEFLQPITRESRCERQQKGPRFWPF
jgi:hypothetical protein